MAITNLSDFAASITQSGLARLNQYIVTITIPQALQLVGLTTNTISLYCKQVALPGVNLNTTHVQDVDLPWENSISSVWSGFNCVFYVDSDLNMRRFFDLWMSTIYNPTSHSMGWYSDYVTDITVQVLNFQQDVVYTYQIKDAYPRSVSPLELAYGANDTFMELAVDFSFHYIINDAINAQMNGNNISASPGAGAFVSWLSTPDSTAPVTFAMPSSTSSQTFLAGISSANSFITSGFQTAGNLYGLYLNGSNAISNVTGAIKSVTEMSNAVKNSKSIGQTFNAAVSIGSTVTKSSTNILANASSIASKSIF